MAMSHSVWPVRAFESEQMRVRGSRKNLVLIDGQVAHGAGAAALRARGSEAILPDQLARSGVERLNDIVRIGQIDDAVVHQGRGLIGSALRSSTRPRPGADRARCHG